MPGLFSRIADIPLPVHPEGFQLDPASRQVFVNLPKANTIAAADRRSGKLTASWPVAIAGANFPMALRRDFRGKYSPSFATPRSCAAFSIKDGALLASADVCGDADDLFFDPTRQRVYVSCGEGLLDVLDAKESAYRHVARIATVPGARTSLFVPELDRLLLAVRAAGRAACEYLDIQADALFSIRCDAMRTRQFRLGTGSRSDTFYLYAARAARGFGDGFAAIILPAYLLEIGFNSFQIGLVATVALLGSAAMTLAIGFLGPRYDLRTLLLVCAALMVVTGIGIPNAQHIVFIAVIAFIGTINPTSGDIGVHVPLEQASLAQEASDKDRTRIFARYSLIGALSIAAGLWRRPPRIGWSQGDG